MVRLLLGPFLDLAITDVYCRFDIDYLVSSKVLDPGAATADHAITARQLHNPPPFLFSILDRVVNVRSTHTYIVNYVVVVYRTI